MEDGTIATPSGRGMKIKNNGYTPFISALPSFNGLDIFLLHRNFSNFST
jgi:hypothetical protein